jgi:hypothetical protein
MSLLDEASEIDRRSQNPVELALFAFLSFNDNVDLEQLSAKTNKFTKAQTWQVFQLNSTWQFDGFIQVEAPIMQKTLTSDEYMELVLHENGTAFDHNRRPNLGKYIIPACYCLSVPFKSLVSLDCQLLDDATKPSQTRLRSKRKGGSNQTRLNYHFKQNKGNTFKR